MTNPVANKIFLNPISTSSRELINSRIPPENIKNPIIRINGLLRPILAKHRSKKISDFFCFYLLYKPEKKAINITDKIAIDPENAVFEAVKNSGIPKFSIIGTPVAAIQALKFQLPTYAKFERTAKMTKNLFKNVTGLSK